MTTKTCEKCGWVLAIQDPKIRCPICGTRFKVGICTKCGKPVEYYRHDRCVCRTCYDTVVRKPDAMKRVKQRREAIFNEWLSLVKQVPKEYPTLTEAQWLATVKYFGHCSLCENESVDTRGYFIPFSHGGRYCDWNIVPLCEHCALHVKRNPNYFLSQPRPAGLDKIIEYLEVKLNAAVKFRRPE